MSAEEKVSEAESLKTQGNAAFKAGDMDEAVAQYTDAVSYLEHLGGKGGGEEEKGSSDAVDVLKLSLFNNSAAALIKAGDFAEAAASASKALAVDADNVKALWRRGEARMQFGMLGEAKKDLVAAAKLDPKNKTIRKTYAALKKKVADAKAVEKKQFGGLFGKVSMYTDKADVPEVEGPITHPEGLPKVFFDVEIGGEAAGRIVMEVRRGFCLCVCSCPALRVPSCCQFPD
jgi:tetratricopeptide (TPR) repeat protein